MATAAAKKTAKSGIGNAQMKKANEMMERAQKESRQRAARLAKSLVDFQKTTFDSTAKVASNIQEHSEKLLLNVVNDSEWMPKELQKGVDEWVKMVRKSRSEFIKTMDKSFDLMNKYIARMENAEKTAKKSTSGKKKTSRKRKASASANGRAAKSKSTAKKRAPRKRKAAATAR